jgi:lipid II:glycine glycyltransferase (peptidoglycan interpeptide bridge formation enzyme)
MNSESTASGRRWNELLVRLPMPHFLQSYEWGQVKAQYGWTPLYATWDSRGEWKAAENLGSLLTGMDRANAAALILRRTVRLRALSAPWSVFYLPKGPNMDWADVSLRAQVLSDLETFGKQQHALFVKVDPDVVLGTGIPGSGGSRTDNTSQSVGADLGGRGWRFSSEQIQFRNTVVIDLSASEDELLARMKQKTRYNVRLAARKGVTVRVGGEADFPMLYRMYAETSVRDGFPIRDEAYYRMVWTSFQRTADAPPFQPCAEPLIAEIDGEPVAAILVFYFGGRAYYVYGMSREAHRDKMPNHLLQWEAMRRAKAAGCRAYDLWGAPDEFNESDSMWGVFRFKEGLGGQVVRTLGAWDFVPNRFIYQLYTGIKPRILDLMRSRGKTRTPQIARD